MDLPNTFFQNFPVEFKEINNTDFHLEYTRSEDGRKLLKKGFKVSEKKIISQDNKGYINKSFQKSIDINEKNTVVLNASVGSGKSYAIIQTIKKYYNSKQDYLILVASPFVSLVEQYVKDIHKDAKIPFEKIYNYSDLGRNPDIKYLDKKVHVLTVNTLLGNPGEDGFKNSDAKRKYLNDLISKCKKDNIKVVFIYDEIHDAIQNFSEEFIFSLWKWKDVIHKNFIISATFNEASKVVIEYLAELTENKIEIIETTRKLYPKKQSKLYLHYSSFHNFTTDTYEITNVIEDLLNRDKNIDILCYSKALAKSIINDKKGIGKKLKDKFGIIHDCTSELISNQRSINEAPKNRYDDSVCNIGTNFKTGVSIKKTNHAYVIIMPPRATKMWFRNKYGIFSGGINSVIQALARQRKKGEIHIILPRPDRFDKDSLKNASITELQINEFMKAYNQIAYFDDKLEPVKYFPLLIQSFLIDNFYIDSLQENVIEEIEYLDSLDRENLTRLEFPSSKLFKLNRGEEYLSNSYKFFGEDISAYVTYCAFTNQFINCSLAGISYQTDIFLRENEVQKELNNVVSRYYGEDYFDSLIQHSNFNLGFNEFRNDLFNNFTLRFMYTDKEKWSKVSPFKNKLFEIQLLDFFRKRFYKTSERFDDSTIFRSKYILDSIFISRHLNIDNTNISETLRNKVKLFQILNYFRNKLIDNILEYNVNENNYRYLNNKPSSNFFTQEDKAKFNELVSLIPSDEYLNSQIFDFKKRLSLNSLYSKLIEDFFEYESSRIGSGTIRPHIKKINSIYPIPSNDNNIIDLLTPMSYRNIDLSEEWIITKYGSLEKYNQELQKIIEAIKESLKN